PGIVITNSDGTTAIWPLLTTTPPAPQSGQYTQSWTAGSQPQFVVSGSLQPNTATESSTFTPLTFSTTMVTPGSTFDPASGTLTLSETGNNTALFTGKFSSIVSSISGV